MPLSDEDRTLLRSYVPWDPPSDADLDARFDVLGSWQAVALEAARLKLSQRLDQPSSFAVSGEYSESWNLTELGKLVDTLEGLVPIDPDDPAGGTGGFGVGQVVRANRGR